jgi:3-dehydroquinate synthetase
VRLAEKSLSIIRLEKNMIGFFYPPAFTFIDDLSFLAPCHSAYVYSGLAEVFKYALIQDAPGFRLP